MRITRADYGPRLAAGWVASLLLVLAPVQLASAPIDLSFPTPGAASGDVDLDADGVGDLLNLTYEYGASSFTLSWRRGIVGGGFEAPQEMILPVAQYSYENLTVKSVVDLNGDHLPEVLIAYSCTSCNCAHGALLIFVNHGPPHLSRITTLNVGENLRIRSADVDGDGDVDLLLDETDGDCDSRYPGFRLLVNNGLGTAFRNLVVIEPPPIAAGDFNNDGHPDILAARSGLFYPSLGDGSLGTAVPISASLPAGPAQFALSRDLDHNATLDAIVGTPTRVHVLLGDGHGVFSDDSYAVGTLTPAAAVDLDGDNDSDYAFGSGSDLVLFHHRTGSRFDWAAVPFNNPVIDVVAGDFNLDGLPDFLDGDGNSFQPVLSAGIGAYNHGRRYEGSIAGPHLLDADRDGRLDLHTTGLCGELFYAGLDHGEFKAPLQHQDLGDGFHAFLLADVDGDTIPDAIVSQGYGYNGFRWFHGLGNGDFVQSGAYEWPGSSLGLKAAAVADLDGDGDQDIVAARDDNAGHGDIAVILNRGGGVFDPAIGYALGIRPTTLVVGDFDQDRVADIVTNGWVSFAVVLHGRGDGAFDSPRYVEAGTPGALAAADFDNDGKLDLAAHVATGVQIRRNVGGGTFTPTTFLPTLTNTALTPILVTDSNHDGRSDLLVVGPQVQLVRAHAGGGFDPPVTLPDQGTPTTAGAADFDGDGNDEVVVSFAGGTPPFNTQVQVYREEAPGTFVNAGGGCSHGRNFVTGDFSGDGRPDVLTTTALFVNRTATVTPVALSDFVVDANGRQTTLRWTLSEPDRLAAVDVERGQTATGPFVIVTSKPLAPRSSMTFDDVVDGETSTAWYRIVLIQSDGVRVASTAVGVQLGTNRMRTELSSVVPNAAGDVAICYQVGASETRLDLGVYDIRGRRVATVVSGVEPAGTHVRTWSVRGPGGGPLARGVYWLRLKAGSHESTRSFVHLHAAPAR